MKTLTSNHIVFFSPTHTSAKIARAIGEGIGMGKRIEIDLTTDQDDSVIEIKDSVAIIAVPVYAGRVAPIALQRLQRLRGNNAFAILVALYGNRDYEDALVELRDETMRLGFTPLAAGAFIGEHSYSRPNMPIAAGRPDTTDLLTATQFGKDCLAKLEREERNGEFYIKGNIPYRLVGPSTPAAPTCTEECFACGECIGICPTHAIAWGSDRKIKTEVGLCIKCCACVKECPNNARIFDTPYTPMLHQKCAEPRNPELFL
ncbi:MAG: ferredoxin [Phocaeicola sp.]|nr:ferredoxin [Phocaeicola sp.]